MEEQAHNVWAFQTQIFDEKFFREKEIRDYNLINRFLKRQHMMNLANLCFKSCVNKFDTSALDNNELSCLKDCKTESLKFLFTNNLPAYNDFN